MLSSTFLDDDGRPSFNIFQNYGSSKAPVLYFVFDVMVLAGRDVMREPLEVRRELLENKILPKLAEPSPIRRAAGCEFAVLIESVKAQGLEGLVAKRLDSRYEAGLRSGAWQKMRVKTARGTRADLLERGDASLVSFNMSERDIELIMRQPWNMTSTDGDLVPMGQGKPHPRAYGAFPRKLRLYVRDRGVIELAFALRSMTSLPAQVFALKDRGQIRPGAFADILVFDPAKVNDAATYQEPHQFAEGMTPIVVNGVLVRENGQFRSDLPGRVLSPER